jgi:hypothetical protein
MAFKSNAQPHCLVCGTAIAKLTDSKTFGGWNFSDAERHATRPASRAEAEQLVNGRVVAVRYHDIGGERRIYQCSTWDGESYVDEFFCNGDHAKTYGYAAARVFKDRKGKAA